jgi:hypothetical protein
VTWINTKRARRKARRSSEYHLRRIQTAETSRQKLSAACGWLISEAWQAGRVAEVHGWVIDKVHELRKEASKRDDHAA